VTFSVAAIAFSGTRGAWLGLLAGASTVALLEFGGRRSRSAIESKRMMIGGALVFVLLILAMVIVSSPASRDVGSRARSFVEDRFTGSGRILLWRDSLKMVPRFALIGSGPEAFSREFLAFKSAELARSAPRINNENPHNAFLDTAVTVGLPGVILYAALICSAFSLLVGARRRTADRKIALICSGLLASLVAVSIHNLFIYDQIPTGLYFFTFNALALAAWNIVTTSTEREAGEELASHATINGLRWSSLVIAISGATLLAAATWFAASIIDADVGIKRAMLSARAADFEGVIAHGERASRSLDPTGAYNLQFARALAIYADSIPANAELAVPKNAHSEEAGFKRAQAIEAAVDQAERSLATTLTPDASYVLLAYLALAQGDNSKLHEYAGKAIDWDPNYFNARWLMAEALLAQGDRDGAALQAQLALWLRPASSEARSILARTRGESLLISPRILGLLERARSLMKRRNFDKAEDLLQRAIRDARGPCLDCHRQLALTYEAAGRYKDAIVEWEIVALGSSNEEEARQARAQIEILKNK